MSGLPFYIKGVAPLDSCVAIGHLEGKTDRIVDNGLEIIQHLELDGRGPRAPA